MDILCKSIFGFSPDAQTWPRELNTLIGGTTAFIYLVINDLGTPSGSGLDFVLGFTFLERFYTVYETVNQLIGFAQTEFTDVEIN